MKTSPLAETDVELVFMKVCRHKTHWGKIKPGTWGVPAVFRWIYTPLWEWYADTWKVKVNVASAEGQEGRLWRLVPLHNTWQRSPSASWMTSWTNRWADTADSTDKNRIHMWPEASDSNSPSRDLRFQHQLMQTCHLYKRPSTSEWSRFPLAFANQWSHWICIKTSRMSGRWLYLLLDCWVLRWMVLRFDRSELW